LKKQEIDVMRQRTMTTVGEYLKKAREARNLSVREVAAYTKISPKYIQCIEDNDYDHLPKGPYIKGYISAYALQVCGEYDSVLELYASCNQPPPPTTMTVAERPDVGDGAATTHPHQERRQWMPWKGACSGLSILRRLLHALPACIRRPHAAGDDASSSLCCGAPRHRSHYPAPPAVNRVANHREAILKWVGYAAMAAALGTVLLFAVFGVYHVFIHGKNLTAATAGRHMQPISAAPASSVESAASRPASKAAGRKTATRKKPPEKEAPAAGGVPSRELRSPSSTPVSPAPDQASRAAPSKAAGDPVFADEPPKLAAADDITLIKSRVCTAVEDRMPVGEGQAFPWTTPRVYVWSLVGAADPPAVIHHIYYHGKTKVGDVVLKIGSSHWRTWSFQSLGEKRLQGLWRVDIASDDGQVLRSLQFRVR
jgi:cytoskeletal protein RodZ